MLSKLQINNYRGFQTYKMDGLTQVNLFVGMNNSGKTALLEGIQFLASGGDPVVLHEVAHRRGELIFNRGEQNSRILDICHFFHGHSISSGSSLSFAGKSEHTSVTVKIVTRKDSSEQSESLPSSEEANGLLLRISSHDRGERGESKFPISPDGGVDIGAYRFRRMSAVRRREGPPVRFVGSDSLNSLELASMWDEVTMNSQELDVENAMRILQPDLESLHFLTGMLSSGYSPARGGIVVGLKGQKSRFPLGSMGDGMRRVMALATSLAFARGGSLLVDEIDTGLHYSVMANMWKLVANNAVASNTQVFATTHSWDCIEGISLLCQMDPSLKDRISVHKIDRAIPHSIAFSGDSIVKMVRADIDPR